MFIRRLLIEHVRNLSQVSINELALLNVFIGPNGSGKTSLLESIAIVSQGRSFRSSKIQTIINSQQSALSVFAECVSDTGQVHKLGVSRDRGNHYQVRIDGASADSLAQLSSRLPTLTLDANAFELLDGSPARRCSFLDWGVFHVEHQFYPCWKKYQRVLKQRNTLLRKQVKDYQQYQPWDHELCQLAAELERFRLNFLLRYQPVLEQVLLQLDAELCGLDCFYRNGWQSDKIDVCQLQQAVANVAEPSVLQQQLFDGFARDLKYQRSHLGPHRADLQLRIMRQDVRDILSRGQKKTLVAAMKLAQAKLVSQIQNKRAVLLLDDLPAELDHAHLTRFIDFVRQEGFQCFISTVDQQLAIANKHDNTRMFHVEHGRIIPVNGNTLATGE